MANSVDPDEMAHYSSESTLFALVLVLFCWAERVKVNGYFLKGGNFVKIVLTLCKRDLL